MPSWYKTPKKPIGGSFFEEQARMFQKQGHQVGILFSSHTLSFLGNTRFNIESKIQNFIDDGIPTFYSRTQSYLPIPGRIPTKLDVLQTSLAGYRKYLEYKKTYGKPDIIHAHSVKWGGVIASYISDREQIPYFLTKHFTGWIIGSKRHANAFRKLLIKTVENSIKTFVVSSYYKQELLKKYSLNDNKLKVVPNIVSSIFYENRCESKIENPVRLVVIGYLIKRKNHLMLFQALKLLNDRGLNTHLKVIGSGRNDAYEKELKSFVINNNLEKQIEFAGLLNRLEVVEAIKESHILLSGSTFETFGVNIIEGLSIGRPCVVFDSGGPRDIMRKKDGILFSEKSSKAFANAIQEIINNYECYDQREISESCINRFGEKTIYNIIFSEYLQA